MLLSEDVSIIFAHIWRYETILLKTVRSVQNSRDVKLGYVLGIPLINFYNCRKQNPFKQKMYVEILADEEILGKKFKHVLSIVMFVLKMDISLALTKHGKPSLI